MDNTQSAYHRVLLKLSGEALAGEGGTGLDFRKMKEVCQVIARCVEQGVEIGIVVVYVFFMDQKLRPGLGELLRGNKLLLMDYLKSWRRCTC